MPPVVILWVAAQKDHTIHERGTAEANAARMIDDPAVEMPLRHGRVPAHVGPIRFEVLAQAAGDPNGPAGVWRPLLEQEDPDRVF